MGYSERTKKVKTVDTILEDMENRVKNNIPVSPGDWVDGAIKINALIGCEENLLAEMEAEMMYKEAELIEEDLTLPASKAKILKTKAINYKEYLTLKAKINRVDEFIKLAKRRAIIESI